MEERKLLTKMDLRLMPLISVLYILSFLDRVNIGNAKLAHIERDLGLYVKSSTVTTYHNSTVSFNSCTFDVGAIYFLRVSHYAPEWEAWVKRMAMDFPEAAKWLTEDERQLAIKRLRHDAGRAHSAHFRVDQIVIAASDWKVWTSTFIFMGIVAATYSFSFFIPTIVNGMGFNP
ncbi:525_t:CDS:2, partial [Acaulospora colombiana]